MATIPVLYEKEMEVRADEGAAFAVVGDVERTARLFPGLEIFDRVPGYGPQVYRWASSRFEVKGFSMTIDFLARYTVDAKNREVRWTSIPGEGSVHVDGCWRVSGQGKSTRMSLRMALTVDLPIHRFMLRMATPFVAKILEQPGDSYMEQVRRAVEEDYRDRTA